MNIDEWVEGGMKYIHPQLRPNCLCNALLEHQHSPEVAALFFEQCQGCTAQYRATAGLAYDPIAGGFSGAGHVASPEAYVPRVRTPTPPRPPTFAAITTPIPQTGDRGIIPPHYGPMIHPTQPFQDLRSGESTVTNSFIQGGGSGLPQGTGGYVDTGLQVVKFARRAGMGRSRCPGPYNYNPATGGCDPKPDYTSRIGGGPPGLGFTDQSPACPPGYVRQNGQCVEPVPGAAGWVERTLPGGASGYQTAEGVPTDAAVIPNAVTTYRCPRGYVMHIDGYCAKKPVSMKDRMYPYHRPALSYGDMKAIRRAARLKKRMVKLTKQTGAWASVSKPSPRKVGAPRPMRQIGPGPSIINVE